MNKASEASFFGGGGHFHIQTRGCAPDQGVLLESFSQTFPENHADHSSIRIFKMQMASSNKLFLLTDVKVYLRPKLYERSVTIFTKVELVST